MYDFYLFLFISTLLKAFRIFIKKDIYENNIKISEEVIITSIVILFLFILYYKFIENQSFSTLINKLHKNKKSIVLKILSYDILLAIGILVGGYILLKEKVIFGEAMKIAGYLFLISIFSCFKKSHYNIYYFIGILFIILGAFFLEYADK